MRQNKVLGILILAAALATFLIPVIFGACQGQAAAVAGDSIPMKCHWTMRAAIVFGAVVVICAAIQNIAKEPAARKAIAAALIFMCGGVFFLATPLGIGICTLPDMTCVQTTLALRITLAILLVLEIVFGIQSGKRKNGPKRGF